MMGNEASNSEKEDRGFFYGYVVAGAGFVNWLITWGTYTTFGIFFMPVLTEFGWTRADTALAHSIATIVTSSLAIATGWLTDKLGPRMVVTVFGSFLGLAYLLMSQISSIEHFYIYFGIVAAIGLSTANPPIMATVSRWFVKKRGLMIGIVQAGVGVGGFILAPLAGWLILSYGWRSSYIVLGMVTLAVTIISGLFLRRDPRDLGQLPDGAKELTAQPEGKPNPSVYEEGNPLWREIGTKRFWIIAGLYSSFGFCRAILLVHTAAYVQDVGFSLADGANVTGALVLSSIVGRIGMGRAADLIGSRQAFMISYAATTIALAWGLITRDLWGLYLFAFIFGFGWGAQAVLRFSITSEAFGLASLGLFMGVLGISEAGAAAFGAYYAGYIFDIAGNYHPAFWLGIAVSLVGIVLNLALKKIVRP